jgi:hypothetical protein
MRGMTEEERLQIQNSTSLCIALISFSVALIGGAVAGFLAVADKIHSGGTALLLALLVIVAIIALTVSIFFGGRGVSATNAAINASPNHLIARYDNGFFSLQVICGVGGLGLGAIAFVLLAVFAVSDHEETPKLDRAIVADLHALQSAIDKTGSLLDKTGAQVDKAGSELNKAGVELHAVDAQLRDLLTAVQANEQQLNELLTDAKLLVESRINAKSQDHSTPKPAAHK